MDFDARINALNDEVTRLKTAHIKSAATLATKTADISVSLPLQLVYYSQIYSTNRAIITATINDNSRPLTMLTLNGSTDNGRKISIMRRPSNAGTIIYAVSIDEGNSSDYDTIIGGGSVTVSLSLRLTATADFTTSVSYEGYSPWG